MLFRSAYATIKVLATTQAARPVHVLVNQVQRTGEGRAVRAQLQQVVDRFVSPRLPAPLVLGYLGELPYDMLVRDCVQRRQLLLEAMPGSAPAQALSAAAGKLASHE